MSPADMAALPSAARAAGSLTPSPQPRTSCAISNLGTGEWPGRATSSSVLGRLALQSGLSPLLHQLGVQNLPGQAGDSDQSGSAGNAPLQRMHLTRPT